MDVAHPRKCTRATANLLKSRRTALHLTTVFYFSPNSDPAASSRLSRAQSRQHEISADASRWASTQPSPRPHSFRLSTRPMTSASDARAAAGRAARSARRDSRWLRLPQASPVHKRMSKDQTITQEVNENGLPLAKMSDPHRSINPEHQALLRRGMSDRLG